LERNLSEELVLDSLPNALTLPDTKSSLLDERLDPAPNPMG